MFIKQKIALLFDDERRSLEKGEFVEYFISSLIIINAIAILLEYYNLLSIIPFYILYLIKVDLRMLSLLRLVKLKRYFKSLSIIKNEIIGTLFLVLILLILSSMLMYNIEKIAQSEAFQNIEQALW
ncbi:hypothetical protein [Tenacibaculum maritimum]|uniref:hypothetical protein n=1 Tax=Tenacibaculum maritimum TaxID=107401 RepID=UPI001914ED1E|nr:hypothetical protein [Tenacibaculum maritimum]MCD9562095.1 hypothetical protein [Tenacibaculum maritimum]MCD9565614.1 hypothetical protein [Tenacibaculum maritimum]MCD9578483.1 hypothetical protein [Tenacibaculum maritimum]MCD9596308.1 hypothetical protein [Tenacibaculum maritimum]MCD9612500.1 hypothetical protein [Tenacibaculum maritimum]